MDNAGSGAAAGGGWDSHVSVSGKAGSERQLGEVEAFLPLWQDGNSLLFGDLRGQQDADGNLEGNVGLGYRQQVGENWIVGGYGFFDQRRTDSTGNTFRQGTFGIEGLSEDLDLRANFYLPESSEKIAPGASTAELVGSSIQLRLGQERALPGADAEIGYRLWQGEEADREVRLYAGGYYFDAPEYETVGGGRARLEYRMLDLDALGAGSRLTLGAEGQWDPIRGTQGFAVARLRIPLGGVFGEASAPQPGLSRRMTESVVRDVDVVTHAAATGPTEAAVKASTGAALTGNVVIVDGSGSLVDAIATAGTDGLVIAQGGAGVLTGGVTMQDGQTLLGGGGGMRVRGANSGIEATFTAPGSQPTVRYTGNAPVITVANSTSVSGLDIRGAGVICCLAANDGVYIPAGTIDVMLARNTIADVAGSGVFADISAAVILLRGNDISNTWDYGIEIGWYVDSLSIVGNTVSDTGRDGINFGLGVTRISIDGNNIIRLNGAGVWFGDSATDVVLSKNTIDEAAVDGIQFGSGADNVTLSDNEISNTSGAGIRFLGTASNVWITGNRISNSGGLAAIDFFSGSPRDTSGVNVTISDNIFAGTVGTTVLNLWGGSFYGSGNVDQTNGRTLCTENAIYGAQPYTGTGFTFIDGSVCGDG